MASKLFVEKGFERTTMEDIASGLGLHKGSLYHHINSKAELFYDVVMMGFDETISRMEEVCRSTQLDPEEKFRKIIAVHFDNIRRSSFEYQVLLNERRHQLDRKQEKTVRTIMKAYENYLFEVVKEGVRAGVFRDDLNPRVVVSGIIGVGNAIYKWFKFDGSLTYDDVVHIYTQFFLRGLMRDKPA